MAVLSVLCCVRLQQDRGVCGPDAAACGEQAVLGQRVAHESHILRSQRGLGRGHQNRCGPHVQASEREALI
jgi:hypothetical protein